MRNIFFKIVLFACAVIFTNPVFSQPPPPPPGGGPGTPCCWPPPCVCSVPLNSGAVILILIGLGSGVALLYRLRKQQTAAN